MCVEYSSVPGTTREVPSVQDDGSDDEEGAGSPDGPPAKARATEDVPAKVEESTTAQEQQEWQGIAVRAVVEDEPGRAETN